MTTVERFDTASGTWEPLTYGDFAIEHGLSDIQLAPTATVDVPRTEPVTAGERLRIQENGSNIFIGDVTKTKPRTNGPMRVNAEHDAHRMFEETIDLSVGSASSPPDDVAILGEALSRASGSFTLEFPPSATQLGEPYEVEGRSIKRVFRDICDRVGRVWWVGIDDLVYVQPYGEEGLLASVDTATDSAAVSEYVPDDTASVVNDVTVYGTGSVAVTGTATDSTSINTYGLRPTRANVEYITDPAEAAAYANELLSPEPAASATIRVASSVANVAVPVVNHDLDVLDNGGTGMDDRLVIEKQTVTQGSAELQLGEGAGINVATFNRAQKSDSDKTAPGAVMGSDRIGALSITETKIDDTSISTPKLKTNAITANVVDTLALETNQLTIGVDSDSGFEFRRQEVPTGSGYYITQMVPVDGGNVGDSIGAPNNSVGSVYSNSVDPATDNVGNVGSSSLSYDEMWAYDYFDADTGTALSDGGDPLAGLAAGRGPPEWAERTDDDGATQGVSINGLAKGLADICRAQQRVIEDLETRVADLERSQ